MCDVSTDLLMQVEGARVLALVPTDGSYFNDVAVQSGNWTSPATCGGTLPKNMDNVWIPEGIDVAISSDVSKDASGSRVAIHALRVDGTLEFDPSRPTFPIPTGTLAKLLVDTIVVTGPTVANPNQTGTIQIGTPANPIPFGSMAEIVFADNGPINAPANTNSALSTLWPDGDPYEFSRGLIVMGNATMDGAEVTSEEPVQPGPTGETSLAPGTTTLTLANVPANWNVGDQLVVTGNPNATGLPQDELVTLQRISGNTVTISAPLQDSHYAPAGASIYVADLARNIVITSENTAVQDRGHVMFMHAVNPEQIDAVAFNGLGRTDKSTPINDPVPIIDPGNPGTPTHPNYIESPGTGTNPRGRYAVHFHHDCQDGAPDTINDCAVDGSPGWGIVNHTSNVDVTNNVVYDVFGACYVTEAGDEIGSFRGNIAIHSFGASGQFSRNNDNDFGFDGDGFWFQGGNISVVNNVAADTEIGFIFAPFGLGQKLPVSVDANGKYTFQFIRTEIPASLLNWLPTKTVDYTGGVDDSSVPLKEFANNTVFAAASGGFEAWGSTPGGFGVGGSTPTSANVINNLHVYDTGSAVFIPYSDSFVFNHLVATGDVNDAYLSGVGLRGNGSTYSVALNSPDIEGFRYGVIAPPPAGTTSITDGTLRNVYDVTITPAQKFNVGDGNQVVTINGNTFLPLSAASAGGLTQYDVVYTSNFNLAQPNMAQLYDHAVGSFSSVTVDGQQLYYDEQASDFIPFPTALPTVPTAYVGLTNAEIYSRYGLAIGGAVAPAGATVNPPGFYGILGSPFVGDGVIDFVSDKKD